MVADARYHRPPAVGHFARSGWWQCSCAIYLHLILNQVHVE